MTLAGSGILGRLNANSLKTVGLQPGSGHKITDRETYRLFSPIRLQIRRALHILPAISVDLSVVILSQFYVDPFKHGSWKGLCGRFKNFGGLLPAPPDHLQRFGRWSRCNSVHLKLRSPGSLFSRCGNYRDQMLGRQLFNRCRSSTRRGSLLLFDDSQRRRQRWLHRLRFFYDCSRTRSQIRSEKLSSTLCDSTNLNRRSRYPVTSPLTSVNAGRSLPSVWVTSKT